jgi:hypothetical protein
VILVTGGAIAAAVRWGLSRDRLAGFVRLSAAAAVLCSVLAVGLWRGNFSWFIAGYMTGTEKFPLLARNNGCNLGAILSQTYGWKYGDKLYGNMTIDQFMLALYAVALLACAVGATLHARRNSPRFVAAIVAPWVLSFALMPQMDGRYLLYGAAAASAMACLGIGPVLLGIVLTAMNFCMMLKFMLKRFPDYWPGWTDFLSGIEPGIGWAVLLAAAVMLSLALTRERRLTVRSAGDLSVTAGAPTATVLDVPETPHAFASRAPAG